MTAADPAPPRSPATPRLTPRLAIVRSPESPAVGDPALLPTRDTALLKPWQVNLIFAFIVAAGAWPYAIILIRYLGGW